MARLKLSIIILLLSFNCFANSKRSSTSISENNDVYKILSDKETQTKFYDKICASNIIQTYKSVDKNKLSLKTIKNTQKSILKNKNFNIFKDWIVQVKKVHLEKNAHHLQKYCQYIINQKEQIPLKIQLQDQAKSYCYNKYIELVTKRLIKNIHPEMSELQIIAKNIFTLTSGYSKDELYLYLDLLKKRNLKKYQFLSQNISEMYLSKKIVPDLELLKHINISANLTRFIQIKGIETDSIYNVFGNRLKILIDDAFESADKNQSKTQVSLKIDHVLNFYNLNTEHLPSNFAIKNLLSLGKSLSRRSYFKEAKNIFQTITKQKGYYYEKAIFELLWVDIVNNNYKNAYKSILSLNILKELKQLNDSKLMYWIAYTLFKNDIKNYQSIMQNVVDENPLSFYAVMSAKVLQENLKQTPDQIYKKLLTENKFPYKVNSTTFTKGIYRSIKRLKVWAKLNSKIFIKLESKNLKEYYVNEINLPINYKKLSYQKELITFLNAKVLFNSKNYLESFKVIYNGLDRSDLQLNYNVLSTLFPRPYWRNIKKYVSGFDPIIALSLIRQESGFNPKARSHVGARGLMQLMPATARMYRKRLRKHHLERPNLNIKIGSKYFTDLLSKYDNNLVYALSAYNAGEGRVNHWQNNYLTSDSILHNIENIPFLETRKYVKLIFRNIFFYKLIDSKNQLPDSNNKNKLFNIALGFQQ